MSIPYPTNTESKYPEYMRKVAKLSHVLADDWWNYDNDTGDVEWVPNLIQAEIGKRGEENRELYTLVMKANDHQLEIWFSGDAALDVDYLIEELNNYKDEAGAELSEPNVVGWVDAVETLLLTEMSEDDIVERIYDNDELLDSDWNEKVSETIEMTD